VEGIGRLEHQMDDFAHMQMEMQAFIDTQTSMMHDLFGPLGLTLTLKSFKDLSLGEVLVPSMSPRLSHFIPIFSNYLITCPAHWSYQYHCHDC
jgi:hypothetical protein